MDIEVGPPPRPPIFLPLERQWLLAWARGSIARHLMGGSAGRWPAEPPPAVAALRSCMVAIRSRSGTLRGCMGSYDARQPLWQQVQESAIAAATADSRFVPLAPHELDTCVMELTVLTPPQPLLAAQLRPGEQGVWVERPGCRGVVLPHVAASFGWDAATCLEQACIRAGLDAEAWRDDSVAVYGFVTEAFSESERWI